MTEMNFYENLFLQAIKNSSITFSLQHAVYKDFGNNLETKNYNVVQYYSSVADKILLWGEDTKNLFKKYGLNNTFIVGKPVLINKPNNIKPQDSRYIVVLLDSIRILSENIKILKSVSNNNKNLIFKIICHPNDTYSYNKSFEKVDHSFIYNNNCIVCGFNSTAIIQYGTLGYNVYLNVRSDFYKRISSI